MARFNPLHFAFAATFVSSMPALAEPVSPGVSPARIEAQHSTYRYYPAHGIYYSPANGNWYWNEDSAWQSSERLPATYQQYTTNGVTIMLSGDEPYDNHAQVIAQYGEPRMDPGKARPDHPLHD